MSYYKPPQQVKKENPNVVGNVLKDTAKAVLPVGAAALGNMLLPGIGGAAAGALTSSIMNNIMAYGGSIGGPGDDKQKLYNELKARHEKGRQAIGTNDTKTLKEMGLTKPYNSNDLAKDYAELQRLRKELGLGIGEEASYTLPHVGQQIRGAINGMLGTHMANGGPLTEYEGGGTHEQNPNGGIPVGKFLVEDGETNFDNYIFSNRLQISKDTAKELGFNMKDMSYADASKKIKNKYKDRENDPAAKKAMIKELGRLKQAHEIERISAIDKDFNEFSKKYGGYLKSNGGQITMAMGGPLKPGDYGYDTPKEMFNSIKPGMIPQIPLSNVNIPDKGPNVKQVFNTEEPSLTYEDFVKQNAYVDNPIAKKAYDKYVDTFKRSSLVKPSDVDNFSYNYIDEEDELPAFTESADYSFTTAANKNKIEPNDIEFDDVEIEEPNYSDTGAVEPTTKDNWMDKVSPYTLQAARMAPVATNLINLYRMSKSKPEAKDAADYMSNVDFEANLVDREQINRDIRNSEMTAARNIRDASGGNSARFIASRMGLNTRANTALANANLQSDQLDAQELARVQNANYTQDANNLRMKLQIDDINDSDFAAYESQMMDQIGLLGQNVGLISKEAMDRNTANSLYDYYLDKMGKVKYNTDGSK